MLAADLRRPERLAALRRAWAAGEALRVAPALDEGEALALLEATRREPHALVVPEAPPIRFQFWKWAGIPEAACEHALCRLGRWTQTDLLAWVEAVTGLALAPPPEGPPCAAALYTKGSYLDAHDDYGRGRAVAYVLGLTPAPWPEADGGWLEFLAAQDGPVVEARPPGWNTLDLFDVRAPGRWHRVTLLREHHQRRTIAGWFHPR
ncbi:MAG: 2OG-Fe(II) oxygenase [Planctomycetes bacterium]|nr:2OG-Fe(II) oxygenase [Planctomycetota bacterium]